MDKSLKHKALAGIIWKLLENGGTQGIQLVTTIVLARLVDPKDYGPLSLTVIFISIATILVQSGFGMALIQRQDVTDEDFSSAFWLSTAAAAALAAIFFFAAPLVARYYGEPQVAPVLRVLSLTLFFYGGQSVQNAMIVRRMEFRKVFTASLAAVLVSGAAGIALAYRGFGVWALVAQQLLNIMTLCLALWAQTRWVPRLVISLPRTKQMFSFGWKLLVSGVLNTLYLDVSGLIVGKMKGGTEELAYYSKGKQFPQYIGANINTALQSALFPAYAVTQNDPERLLAMLRRTVSSNAFLLTPLLFGLAAIAEPMVRVLLTDKWLPCVPYLRIACLTYAMYPLDSTILHAFNALGRSDLYLKLEIVKKAFGAALLCAAVFILRSPVMVAWGVAVTNAFSVAVNMGPIKRLLGYRLRDQLFDILPQQLVSAAMALAVFALTKTGFSPLPLLLCQIAAGALVYALLAFVFLRDKFTFILRSAREFIQHKKDRATTDGGDETI